MSAASELRDRLLKRKKQTMSDATGGATVPIVCGHRGAPAVSPENRLASFRAAADRGATWIEFDVRPTSDGQIVIHHDPRTADGTHIASSQYAKLDADIPRFGDLVDAMPTMGFDLEIKTDDIGMDLTAYVDLVVTQIDMHEKAVHDLLVTSFDGRALALLHARRPAIRTGLLFWNADPDQALRTAVAAGHVAIAPSIALLSPSLVSQARANGLDIITWTVNTPKQVRKAVELGVDMIIGDDPAVIIDNL